MFFSCSISKKSLNSNVEIGRDMERSYCQEMIKKLIVPLLNKSKEGFVVDDRSYFLKLFSFNKGCFIRMKRKDIIDFFGVPHSYEGDKAIQYRFYEKGRNGYDFYEFVLNESSSCKELIFGELSFD